jgi:hypothetical protein
VLNIGWPAELRSVLDWWQSRLAAQRRADELVRRALSDAERRQLEQTGFLEVRSGLVPGRRYRIPACGAPIAVLEPDGRLVYLCLQPSTPVARQELVVVHKLLLEGAEADYWVRANRVGRIIGRGFGRPLLA